MLMVSVSYGKWRSSRLVQLPFWSEFANVARVLVLPVAAVIGQVYGPSAWWWEVEELVRKLMLSAVVVLFDPGSPLQVLILVGFLVSRS